MIKFVGNLGYTDPNLVHTAAAYGSYKGSNPVRHQDELGMDDKYREVIPC